MTAAPKEAARRARLGLLALAATLAACTSNPTLTLEIATPPNEDTFAGVATLRVKNADPLTEKSAPYVSGTVTVSLGVAPSSATTHVEVDGLDANGVVLAHGASPPFSLGAYPAYLRIYVAKVGAFGAAPLPTGSAPTVLLDAAICGFSGVGALVVGGHDAAGAPAASAWAYDEFLHLTAATGAPAVGRSGATVVDASDGYALVFGGRGANGPTSALEEFDVLGGDTGAFTTVVADGDATLARSFAPAAVVPGGFLVAGGFGAGDAPVATAVLLTFSLDTGAAGATVVTGAMQEARSGHTLTPTADGLALVWGLAANGPVAEVYQPTSQLFAAVPGVDATLGRSGHSATLLADGRTLIVGGHDPTGAHTGDVIELSADRATTTVHAGLVAPRAFHSATLVGTTLLVAGGLDAAGPRGDAAVIDTATMSVTAQPTLVAARSGHTAILLDSGTVLLIGGVDAQSAPVQALELYTPAL